MAVLFSPWGNQQFSASGTALAVGHKLYTYVADSSTALATYTDSTGGTPQTNPIILNSLGMPTNGQIWLTSGLSYKFVWKDASDVEIKTEDNITGVTSAASGSQWIASGLTPTYVSATSFTLSGDQTSAFHVGRRLQSTTTAGTIYSTITATTYTTLTTVTVSNDSGVLDSGLSAVNYGLLSATNPSVPSTYAKSGPLFSAYASAATSIPNNSATKVNFATEEFDTNTNYDTSTSRFTPTIPGYYRVSGCVETAAASGVCNARLYKNGAGAKAGPLASATASGGAGAATATIFMNGTTDYVELWFFQNSGAAVNTIASATATYFHAELVRAT